VAKDLQNYKDFFNLGVRKPNIYIYQIAPTSAHVVQMSFKKKTHPGSSKNKLLHFQLSVMTGSSNGTGWSDET